MSIILPPGVRSVEPPRFVAKCELCGEHFTEDEAARYMGHVAACVELHAAEIDASRPSQIDRGTVWDPESWDPEAEAYMEAVGKRMLREGRLELKPGEGLG